MRRSDVGDDETWLDGLGTQEAPAEERRRSPLWQNAVLAVVALAYLVTAVHGAFTVAGDLLGWAGDNAFSIAGESRSTGRAVLREDLLALTLRAACIAVIGVVLGLWWRRRLVLTTSAAAIAVALVVGLGSYWLAAEDRPDRPEPEPRFCQEYSGGDTECPGG
ncbi:hypothetical protein ACI78T_17810 [Blastococcus sp. SYSU D00922]